MSLSVDPTLLPAASLFAEIIGQELALGRLRASARSPVHAYLIVGPPGTGKLAAARGFGAAILCPLGGCGECEVCRRVLDEVHPDVRVVQREGASMSVGDAAEVIKMAAQAPVEATRKLIVLDDLHLVDKAGPALLKTIEEPPASTFLVGLAEFVPPELVTIASRCSVVEFGPVSPDAIASALVGEGVDADVAKLAASNSGGRPERARLLAGDPSLAGRLEMWRSVPAALDGSGNRVSGLVDELTAMISEVEGHLLAARQQAEAAALEQREKDYGKRGAGRADQETRHKRERRRVRTDELRLGFATLADYYRARMATADGPALRRHLAALEAIGVANKELIRNPNEQLLLSALLISLA